MPRRFLNLYARILFWLLVNVIVLGGGFFAVLQWQFREGLQGALGGIAGDRLQSIGQQMHAALGFNGRVKWDTLMKDFSERHGVQAMLLQVPDSHVAGQQLILPDVIKRILVDMHPELAIRAEKGRPPPERQPPPRDELEDLLFGENPLLNNRAPRPEFVTGQMPVKLGTFMQRAGDPPLYYTGIRMPPQLEMDRRAGPLMFIIASSSITGGGLFFDIKPWLWGLFGAMAVSALLWLPFVGGITSSIRANMQATEQIAKGQFNIRVPENRSDELGRLSHAVNQMAVQIDGIVRGQKRFLGDIAHELCSPIARMEMSLGILEDKLTDHDAIRLADVREELRQISLLVNELLSFSKTSLGHKMKEPEKLILLTLVDEVAGMEGMPAQHLRIQLNSDLCVRAVPDLLRRAVGNILRNARLHAPESEIEVTAIRRGENILLCFADSGPGVPADSLPRLFDPFYRVDTSRDRQTGGTGLGLAIVKTCIDTCGGTVSARKAEPHGLIIEIELPRA